MSRMSRVLIYLIRRDLRLADNPVFHEISRLYAQSQRPFTHLLPVYLFPAEQLEISGFIPQDDKKSPYPEARSQVGGFWRCGRLRAKFLAESVWDTKEDLESIGSGLEIRVGSAKDVVQSILDGYRERDDVEVEGLWVTREDAWEEYEEEEEMRELLERDGKEFKLWADEKYFVDEYVYIVLPLLTRLLMPDQSRLADPKTKRTLRCLHVLPQDRGTSSGRSQRITITTQQTPTPTRLHPTTSSAFRDTQYPRRPTSSIVETPARGSWILGHARDATRWAISSPLHRRFENGSRTHPAPDRVRIHVFI